VPGLTPSLDALAERGVAFTRAYSVAPWTRPGTIAMLAGARSGELGLETTRWVPLPADVDKFYASSPPLLPLAMRAHGVATRAFVNNFFLAAYAPVGVDAGFERLLDVRDRTKDTRLIVDAATQWIASHARERFFAFVNLDSPHEPWEPPPEMLARVPASLVRDPAARAYLAECAKDDAAIGEVLAAVDAAGLRDRTIVVVTADHGETLSHAHAAKVFGLDDLSMLHHHAVGNYEETIRVPLIVAAPPALGIAPRRVDARMRTTDIAPTILELEGIDPDPAREKLSGRSLAALMRGEREPDERVVVSEGRGTRAVLAGTRHLIVRDPVAQRLVLGGDDREVPEELYDLADDPGERRDLAADRPELVAEMRARLEAALANVPAAGSAAALATKDERAVVHLRFAGGGQARRVAGKLTARDGRLTIDGAGLGPESWKVDGGAAEIAFATAADGVVGVDVSIDPPTAPLAWELTLDDAPWPEARVFAGRFGFAAPKLAAGLTTEDARALANASALPWIDAAREVGLFVTREARREGAEPSREASPEANEDAERMLRAWGYVQGGGR
jgi:arylsulfatase A-like enzyme